MFLFFFPVHCRAKEEAKKEQHRREVLAKQQVEQQRQEDLAKREVGLFICDVVKTC